MKLGFLTGCLNMLSLEEVVKWSGENKFGALEISSWPPANTRDYSGTHLNVNDFDAAKAGEVKSLFDQNGLEIACLTYCENNLHHDLSKREFYHAHLRKVIDAANLLGVQNVSTFIGRDHTLTLDENVAEAARVFPAILDYAKERNVRLAIENCPMPGWDMEGLVGNIAFSPAMWDKLFNAIPHDNLGINMDPSHLYFMEIDHLAAVRDYASRIFHAHAKDTEIFDYKRAREGNFTFSFHSWWRYRMPGLGEINWSRFIDALMQAGFDGTLSTEHEDPIYEGSEEKVKQGLVLGRRHLEQFLP